jgi:hypothetical protein
MKFRKKPVVVEAIQWKDQPLTELVQQGFTINAYVYPHDRSLAIQTLEGTMVALIGDWIIKGVKGEFYPCKPDIFEQTYEPAE